MNIKKKPTRREQKREKTKRIFELFIRSLKGIQGDFIWYRSVRLFLGL